MKIANFIGWQFGLRKSLNKMLSDKLMNTKWKIVKTGIKNTCKIK